MLMKNFTPTKRLFIILTLLLIPYFNQSQTLISEENFNGSTGIWSLGGSNVVLNSTTPYEGSQSVRFRSNSNSTLTTSALNLSSYNKVDVKFFIRSTANSGETITLQYRAAGSAAWTSVRIFTMGTSSAPKDINSSGYHALYGTLFSTDYTFSTTGQFRFSASIGSTSRYFYVDKVSITGTKFNTINNGPGGVTSHLEMWLRADKINGSGIDPDNAPVNKWNDTGKGNNATVIDATNASLTNKPVYKNNNLSNINFNPVVAFNNNPATSEVDYTGLNNRAELNGTSGYFSNEQYIVIINDNPATINSSALSIDVFCAQGALTQPFDRDGTGFGFGQYTLRFDNEVISYCHGSTPTSSGTAVNSRGYGVAQTGSASYANLTGILSSRNSSTINGQELFLNASRIDNTEVGTPQFANYSNRRYWLGRSQVFNGSFNGRIAEVITYSSRKNDATERRRIESYLAIKYGITLGTNGVSMNYQDSNGSTIWDISGNTYCYNITGIGRDDSSQLNQKQSKSVHTANDITIGLGNISDKNSDNTNTFANNRNFLVWGNNNASLAAQPPVVVNISAGIQGLTSNVDFISIGRVWKVVETGGNIPTVKISIPATMLTATITPPGDYLMFISDTGIFNPSSEYRVMKANGANLETDFDFDGTKYITFGYAPENTFERSINFDGIDDYLDSGNVLDLNGSFTVSAWIKPSAANKTILSKRNSIFSTGYNLGLTNAGNIEMSWINGSKQTITSTVAMPLDKWHNVAVSFNGTEARLYIDGVLNVAKTLLPVPVNSQSFLIAAADAATPTSFFAGTIDEVRVWSVALTQDQLRYMMNQEIIKHSDETVNGTIIPQTITLNEAKSIRWSNLKAYYPMSTYTFTNAKDLSGNGYTAALRNLTTVDYQTAPMPYVSATSGDWATPETWQNNTVQDLPNGVSFIDGTTRINWNIVKTSHDIVSAKNRTLLSLDIQSNKITTANHAKIEISHYLKLNGKIDLEGRSQLIQSAGSDLDPTSSGTIERDQQGTSNIYNYNYWSSPVGEDSSSTNNNAYTINDVFKDGTDPANIADINWVNQENGSEGIPINLSKAWIYKFQNVGNDYANWSYIGPHGSLLPGEGFTLKGSGSLQETQNYTFIGKPNNGLISLPIGPGFLNLCGNPYPSALDSQKFIQDNLDSLDGTLYFWEHYSTNATHNLADYQGGYAALTLVGGTPPVAPPLISDLGSSARIPNQFIPVGQGFFVTGSEAGGNIVFNNNQRLFVRETNAFSNVMFRNQNTILTSDNDENINEDDYVTPPDFSKIRLGFTSANQYHRQILMGFMNENATSQIDPGYDALLFDDFPNDMYFINGDSKLVIQGEGYFNDMAIYPLGVKIREEGIVKFRLDEMIHFDEGQPAFIHDSETGEYHSLNGGDFEISLSSGTYENRFSLRFTNGALGIDNFGTDRNVEIVFTTNDNVLNIYNRNSKANIESVTLFNIIGQRIQSHELQNENQNPVMVKVKNLSPGTYIAKLQTSEGNISKKFVVK